MSADKYLNDKPKKELYESKWFTPLVILVVMAVAVFFAFVAFQKAGATGGGWGQCTSTGPQCGTDNGTQSRLVCPPGYEENQFDFTPKDCHKGPIWNLQYAYKVEQTRDCHTGVIQEDSCEPEELECEEGYIEVDEQCVPEETPTPTPEPRLPDQPLTPAGVGPAPSCSNPEPVVAPWNCNLYRYPDHADLFWVPGDSALVDVLFRENSVADWVHSLPGILNIGRATVDHLLPGEAYTFTVRGRNACSGGLNAACVIVDAPIGFFPTTYWELYK